MPRRAAGLGLAVDDTSPDTSPETSADATPGDAYSGAGDHYTSPARRDWVKRSWEEPSLRRHLDAALRRAHELGMRDTLDVLDVGCGTGVALDLLVEVAALAEGPLALTRATGLDLDTSLLAIATRRFADDPRVGFVRGDMSDVPSTGPHDVVLSSGVPFSHLEAPVLERALTRMATVAVAPGTDAARTTLLVIDVLGRYSLEWTTRWDTTRWDYRMSFFATDADVNATPMTTWDGTGLRGLIVRAAGAAGTHVADLHLVDRSLAVGRHTMTGEYTPGLPRLRDLVDGLVDPRTTIDPDALRIDLTLPDAPAEVLAHHRAFISAWNATLEEPVSAPVLAQRLLEVESGFETAGLGVGHSLTAFVVLHPA
jgi:SAM-dependent methyltransferase